MLIGFLCATLLACGGGGGSSSDPGSGSDPGPAADPGSAPDPGPVVDPGNVPDPGPGQDPGAPADPGAGDPGPLDTSPADVPGPDASATPCPAGGFCRPLIHSSCGDPAFHAQPDLKCKTPEGIDGYCCIQAGDCLIDADCPGCQLCELTQSGARFCTDPFADSAAACTKKSQCPQQYCCSFTLYEGRKPECGGMCVYQGGSEVCDDCQGEGSSYYSGDIECCPWLDPVPMTNRFDNHCVPGRAIGSLVCVKKCGDGECTTGEDSCNCPKDCPTTFAGGPGSKCAKEDDCTVKGACLPEASGYPAGGYCTGGVCDPSDKYSLCPAGSTCTATLFSQATVCLPTCRKDADCREGLTCEAFTEAGPGNGGWFCWQGGKMLGLGLGAACTQDDDCISGMCMTHPDTGDKVCTAYCSSDVPCKKGPECRPMGGCSGTIFCGACFFTKDE
jgi:hypothetical protein